MIIRKASDDDIDTLVRLRIDYIKEEIIREEKKPMTNEEEGILAQKNRDYMTKWIDSGGFVAYIAEENGEAISTAFLSIVERPPRKAYSSYLVGTVYSVFTYKEHRRKGTAAKVMTALLEEAKRMGVASVDLYATPDGKPLYEKLGFYISDFTFMKIKLT